MQQRLFIDTQLYSMRRLSCHQRESFPQMPPRMINRHHFMTSFWNKHLLLANGAGYCLFGLHRLKNIERIIYLLARLTGISLFIARSWAMFTSVSQPPAGWQKSGDGALRYYL